MRFDESAMRDRSERTDAGVRLVEISAAVLEQLRAEEPPRERLEDPLRGTASTFQYRVAPYDVLSVIVWDHPELTIPAGEFRSAEATGHPVTADGHMFYPHAGSLPVAGKTLAEVRDLLTGKLAKVLQSPQLDVKVAVFRGYKTTVTGEVKAPATLPLTDVPLRVLDAINACQGASPEADLSRVVLTRAGKSIPLNLQAAVEDGDLSQNWLLMDGDIVHVPDRSRNKVFVLGEVRRPNSKVMIKGRMTLAEALGDSEGLDPETSNAAAVYVIRGTFERPSVFKLDATSPDALLLASAFPLKPNDVVFVSTHGLTQWDRIVRQVLPTVNAISQPGLILRGFIPTPMVP